MTTLADRDPLVTADDLDLDVGDLTTSVEQFYEADSTAQEEFVYPAGLDAALRSVFEDLGFIGPAHSGAVRRSASDLIRQLEHDLTADIYRWTGHFPERTRPLLRHLAVRAEELALVYPEPCQTQALVGLTTLVTTLAMNYVQNGTYVR
jgi:hypothetical protein